MWALHVFKHKNSFRHLVPQCPKGTPKLVFSTQFKSQHQWWHVGALVNTAFSACRKSLHKKILKKCINAWRLTVLFGLLPSPHENPVCLEKARFSPSTRWQDFWLKKRLSWFEWFWNIFSWINSSELTERCYSAARVSFCGPHCYKDTSMQTARRCLHIWLKPVQKQYHSQVWKHKMQ